MDKIKPFFASFALALALPGCMTAPHQAYTANQAHTAPVRNLTSMDLALSCLDRMLVDYRVQPVYVTSTGLPNRAGGKVDLSSGLDMLKTSIGQLSVSNAFHFVDLASLSQAQYGGNVNEVGSRPLDAKAINEWIKFLDDHSAATEFHYPGYIISGSISQLDGNTLSEQEGGSIGSEQLGSLGANHDRMTSEVTLDMQVQDSKNLQVLNGLTTKNTLALVKTGKGMDLSWRMKSVGGYVNVSYDRSEGLHQGIRDLIQLGTIELLGRLAKVPYQQCLQAAPAAPGGLQADEQRFDGMDEAARVRFAQQRLAALPDPAAFDHAAYYQGAASGVIDAATRDAVARYRRQAGLIANGEVDLELYRSLNSQPAQPQAQATAPELAFYNPQGQAVGSEASFPLHSLFRVAIGADRPAHAQCFIRQQSGQVFRVFPTTDRPEDALSPGNAKVVPSPSAAMQIRIDSPGAEELGCVAAERPLRAGEKLPLQALGEAALPAVGSLQEVFEQYRREQGGEPVSVKVLRYDAAP